MRSAVASIAVDPAEVAGLIAMGRHTAAEIAAMLQVPIPVARRALNSREVTTELAALREQIRARVADSAVRVQQKALNIIEDDLDSRRDFDAAVAAARVSTAMVPRQSEITATVHATIGPTPYDAFLQRHSLAVIDGEVVPATDPKWDLL